MVQKSEGIKLDDKRIYSQWNNYELRQSGKPMKLPGKRTKRTYKNSADKYTTRISSEVDI